MTDLLRQIRSIWAWAFRDARLVWLAFGVLAIAALPVWWWKSEPAFRITGMALQLLGVGTVAWGIRKTRELFGRPSMRERFLGWWHRRPRRRHTVFGSAEIALEHSNLIADAEAWSETNPDAGVEVRLTALEKNLLEVRGQFNAFKQKTQMNLGTLTDNLGRETQVRGDEDRDIRTKLEETGVGGLDLSVVGVLWLCFGVIMSALSIELEKMINWIGY